MRIWNVICLWVATAAFGIFLMAGLGTEAATITWVNTSGGSWTNTLNWNPQQVPGSGDTAVITVAGNYSVLLDLPTTVAGLVLGANSGVTTQSFFTGAQSLTINGNGQMQVNSNGQFNLDAARLPGPVH